METRPARPIREAEGRSWAQPETGPNNSGADNGLLLEGVTVNRYPLVSKQNLPAYAVVMGAWLLASIVTVQVGVAGSPRGRQPVGVALLGG